MRFNVAPTDIMPIVGVTRPASGYFERKPESSAKQPYFLHDPEGTIELRTRVESNETDLALVPPMEAL